MIEKDLNRLKFLQNKLYTPESLTKDEIEEYNQYQFEDFSRLAILERHTEAQNDKSKDI